MQTDEIEAALARLMPPALSQGCQLEIEAMFDELAGPEVVMEMPVAGRSYQRWVMVGGIAAAVAAVAAIFPITNSAVAPLAKALSAVDAPSGLVLVGESDRVESMTDEGWQENSDGAAVHAVRLNVVAENSLQDKETGIIMRVSEPREEILLTPISAF
ncbi:MAG: hypothetical protein ABI162_10585 [Luteolibacter sp.]